MKSSTGVTECGTPGTYTPSSDPGCVGKDACAGSSADKAFLAAVFPECAAPIAT